MTSLNFTNIDLSDFDLRALAGRDGKVVAALRDATYVGIGFGVLAVQKAQVRRRELTTTLQRSIDTLETGLDRTVELVEAQLPEPAASVVGQVHELAKGARRQVHGLVRSSL